MRVESSAISDMAQGEERTVQMMTLARQSAKHAAESVTASLGDVRETAQMADEAREVVEQGLEAGGRRDQRDGGRPRRLTRRR